MSDSEVVWRPIPNEDGFEASSLGQIRNTFTGCVRKPYTRESGYQTIRLTNRSRPQFVHRLVAAAFHGPGAAGLVINHIDNDPSNNRPDNLEWVTQSQNIRHAFKQGRIRTDGEHSPVALLTEAMVVELRRRYLAGGVRFVDLANELGLTKSGVRQAIKGITWRHLPGAAAGDFRSTRSGWRR